jgi:hypothetical protein
LQRVNATETAGGIAVTTAHDAAAPLFCRTIEHDRRDNVLRRRERAPALNRAGPTD